MEKDLFIVPLKAAIKQGNSYLILKRGPTAPTYPGHWDFPGGKLETSDRSAGKGLEREVLEETGLQVRVLRPLHLHKEIYGTRNLLFIIYECEMLSGEIELSSEHTDFRWATKDEILELKTERFLKSFFGGK